MPGDRQTLQSDMIAQPRVMTIAGKDVAPGRPIAWNATARERPHARQKEETSVRTWALRWPIEGGAADGFARTVGALAIVRKSPP
jgi:hypothetical protein